MADPAAGFSLRPKLDRKVDAGLAVLGLLVLGAGLGSIVPVVVWAALAWLWWGRPLGMVALFSLALSLALFVNSHRSNAATPRAAAAAPHVARPSSV